MSLPRAVKEQEELADRLYQQAYQRVENTDVAVLEKPQEETPAAQPQPGPTTDPVAAERQSESTPTQEDLESWEHRYKVLNGKYTKEVPRYAAELREMRAQLEERNRELESLKASQTEPVKLVRPEEVEEYGEGLVDLVRRAAREEIADKEKKIEILERKLASFEQNTAKTLEIDYYSRLGEIVPNWVVINDDPRFHRWLSEPDELTGVERQQLLESAEAKRDPVRVAKFFTAWERTTKQREAGASALLESQVAPSATQTVVTPTAKRFWTRAEIARVYAAIRRGEISDAEAQALESEIHAATQERRVR